MPDQTASSCIDDPLAQARESACPLPSRLRRGLLILLGLLSVGLGVLGAFLPLLPTTPFLLLAAACFARSSVRLNHWLHSNPLFGEYLRRYRNGEGIPRRAKIVTLGLLWISLTASAIFAVPLRYWPAWFLLAAVGIGVTRHILHIKTRHSSSQ